MEDKGRRRTREDYSFLVGISFRSGGRVILGEALGESELTVVTVGFTVHTVAERFGHGGLGHP